MRVRLSACAVPGAGWRARCRTRARPGHSDSAEAHSPGQPASRTQSHDAIINFRKRKSRILNISSYILSCVSGDVQFGAQVVSNLGRRGELAARSASPNHHPSQTPPLPSFFFLPWARCSKEIPAQGCSSVETGCPGLKESSDEPEADGNVAGRKLTVSFHVVSTVRNQNGTYSRRVYRSSMSYKLIVCVGNLLCSAGCPDDRQHCQVVAGTGRA